MLVQALALHSGLRDIDEDELDEVCTQSHLFRSQPVPQPEWLGPLLMWEQSGPDASGAVEVESALEFPHGEYAGVCVFASLKSKSEEESRAVSAYIETPELDFDDDPDASPGPQGPAG
jgi:hypothetical protein